MFRTPGKAGVLTYQIIGLSFLLGLISMLCYQMDDNGSFRWPILTLSLLPVFIVAVCWFASWFSPKNLPRLKLPAGFFVVISLALVSRLLLLTGYPFVSIGDEVRDGGLNARQIITGEINDPMGYGRYSAHGLIIPVFTSLFYWLFGDSVLVYRLPAALISVATVILLYLLLYLITRSRTAAFLGSLSLVSLPLHLFYSRVEIVVTLSSFLAVVMLIALFSLFYRQLTSPVDWIFLGAVVGFSFNFHAAVKAMGIAVYLVMCLIVVTRWLLGRVTLFRAAGFLLLFSAFVLVGFGPRLFQTLSVDRFFNASRLPFAASLPDSAPDFICSVAVKYGRSLLVWISEPTQAWYADHRPVLTPLQFCLLLLGLVFMTVRRHGYLAAVLAVALILHLSNSALTDILNGDHRLAPLYPVACLFIGYGAAFVLDRIRFRFIRTVLSAGLAVYLCFLTVGFFIFRPVDKNKDTGDFLSMNTIYFVRSRPDLFPSGTRLVFSVSPANYTKFSYLHYREQYLYFLPDTPVVVTGVSGMGDGELEIRYAGAPALVNHEYQVDCRRNPYRCSIGYPGNLVIRY